MEIVKAIRGFYWFGTSLCSMIFWLTVAILFSVSIVGLPCASTLFKSSIMMFNYEDIRYGWVELDFGGAPVKNGIWCCTFGLLASLVYVVWGLLMCFTLIFIPIGIGCFKMAKYSIAPFEAEFV